jgi:hypothetical protein
MPPERPPTNWSGPTRRNSSMPSGWWKWKKNWSRSGPHPRKTAAGPAGLWTGRKPGGLFPFHEQSHLGRGRRGGPLPRYVKELLGRKRWKPGCLKHRLAGARAARELAVRRLETRHPEKPRGRHCTPLPGQKRSVPAGRRTPSGDRGLRELEENNIRISCRTFVRHQGVIAGA